MDVFLLQTNKNIEKAVLQVYKSITRIKRMQLFGDASGLLASCGYDQTLSGIYFHLM